MDEMAGEIWAVHDSYMDVEAPKWKSAILVHCAGNDVDDIFDTLTDKGGDKDYNKVMKALPE